MFKSRSILIMVSAMLLITSLSGLLLEKENVTGSVLKSYEPALSRETLTFPGPGEDHVEMRLPRRTTVLSASLKMTGEADINGDAPSDVMLDVGDNGDVEWGFSGNGWGQWGHQNGFSDASSSKLLNLDGGGKQSVNVRLPADAGISSASMKVKGQFDIGQQRSAVDVVGIDNARDVQFGDIDGDGDKDVAVIGSSYNGGEVSWYENLGTAWVKHAIDTPTNPTGMVLADIDLDSDLDVVITQYFSGGGVYWYNNSNSHGTVWYRNVINSTTQYMYDPTLVDLDGDGDKDLIANSLYGTYGTWIYLCPADPTSSTQSWTTRLINSSIPGLASSGAGFIDGDSRRDIVVGTTTSAVDTRGIWAFHSPVDILNDSWNAVRIYPDRLSPYDLQCVDVNADGREDVVALDDYYNRVFWMEADATPFDGDAWDVHNITFDLHNPTDLYVADADGDLDPDVLVTGPWDNTVAIYWCPDSGVESATSWGGNTISTSTYHPMSACMADLGGDGDTDVVLSGQSLGDIIVRENISSGNWATDTVEGGGLVSPTVMSSGDIDGDGDEDVLVGTSYAYTLYWYEHPSDPTLPWPRHIVSRIDGVTYGVQLVDMDSDNDLDAVITDYYGHDVEWYENDGTPAAGMWMKYQIEGSLPYYPRDVHAVNLDGVNGTDLVVNTLRTNGPGGLWWYEAPADPTSVPWPHYQIANDVQSCYHIAVGDISGDGRIDVVAPSFNSSVGRLRWYECPVDPRAPWTEFSIDPSMNEPRDVDVIDIDGDGDLDVIASDYANDLIFWYENPSDPVGDPNNWTKHLLDSSITHPLEIVVDDVGEDGFIDMVVTATYNSASYLLRSKMDPIAVWEVQDLDMGLDQPYAAIFANISGDSFDDIIMDSISAPGLYYYETQPYYTSSLSIDVGDNGVNDYVIPSVDHVVTLDGLTDQFATALSNGDVLNGAYGNHYVDIPITFQGSGHNILIYDVDIVYNYTVTLEGDTLKDEMNGYLHRNLGKPTDDLLIPINVTVGSAGNVRFWDLRINYNDPPIQSTEMPTGLHFDEDTLKSDLLDLSLYFTDVQTPPNGLHYHVLSNTNSEHVNFTVVSGYFLQGDATIDQNWNGHSSVRVECMDPYGLEVISDAIEVDIDPVNDKPTPTLPDLPVLDVDEGGSVELDLDAQTYFTDVEDDELFFAVKVWPSNRYIEDNLTIRIDNDTKVLNISANDDYSATGIVLRVFCDDAYPVDTGLNIYKTLLLNVHNVEDPMTFSPLGSMVMDEDSSVENVLDLDMFISDPDNPTATYTFSVASVDNPDVLVGIDGDNRIDVTALDNFFGSANATISVESSVRERAIQTQVLGITVNPVNDLPQVSLTSPPSGTTIGSTNVTLNWTAYDQESDPLTYDIYLDAIDATTRVATGITDTSYTPGELKDGYTYKWKVVPDDGKGTGNCTSGIWSFKVDTSLSQRQKVSVSVSTNRINVDQGESFYLVVTFENTGLDPITVIPSVTPDSRAPGTYAFKPRTSEIALEPGEKKEIELVITPGSSCPDGSFITTISGQIKGTGITGSTDVELVVGGGSGSSYMAVVWILIAVLFVIALVVVIFIVILKRRSDDWEGADVTEEEGVPQEGGGLDAEVEYSPSTSTPEGRGVFIPDGSDAPVLEADIVSVDAVRTRDRSLEVVDAEIEEPPEGTGSMTMDGPELDVELEYSPPDLSAMDDVPELVPVVDTPVESANTPPTSPSSGKEKRYAFKKKGSERRKKDRSRSGPSGKKEKKKIDPEPEATDP